MTTSLQTRYYIHDSHAWLLHGDTVEKPLAEILPPQERIPRLPIRMDVKSLLVTIAWPMRVVNNCLMQVREKHENFTIQRKRLV